MAVKIIIDSASDITAAEAKKLGLIHLPLKVMFGAKEYKDTVDLSHQEFYEKLAAAEELPTTSQLTPLEFQEAYEKVRKAGDTAVVLTLSGKLSGTYQSAMIALEGYEDEIYVVDTQNVCIGERILAYYAMELVQEGKKAKEIAKCLNEQKEKVRVLALLDTLEYLQRGGRISKTVALAGGLLSIKPVVAVKNGEVEMLGKARGAKQGNNLLRQYILEGNGVDFDRPVALAYSGQSDEALQNYVKNHGDLWKAAKKELDISTVGCVIGTHVGPGAIAVAYFEK